MSERVFTKANCMDRLDSLEDESVDLWIIDPPYNVLTGNMKNKNGAAVFHSRYTAKVSPSESDLEKGIVTSRFEVAIPWEEKQKYCEIFKKGFWIDREQNEDGFECAPSGLKWRGEDGKFGGDGEAEKLFLAAEKNSSGKADCLLTIFEGKFHQVKRMFSQVGNEVVYLKRIKMGGLCLDPAIELGSYRELTESEIEMLSEK